MKKININRYKQLKKDNNNAKILLSYTIKKHGILELDENDLDIIQNEYDSDINLWINEDISNIKLEEHISELEVTSNKLKVEINIEDKNELI